MTRPVWYLIAIAVWNFGTVALILADLKLLACCAVGMMTANLIYKAD